MKNLMLCTAVAALVLSSAAAENPQEAFIAALKMDED